MGLVIVWLPWGGSEEGGVSIWRQQADRVWIKTCYSMQELPTLHGLQAVIVVPVVRLTWHQLNVPVGLALRKDSRLLPVLQNMLEEHVLEDSDELHIALAHDAASGHETVVAVCQQAWLQSWLENIEAAGLRIMRVLPEVPPDVFLQSVVCTGEEHMVWQTSVKDGISLSLPLECEGNVPLEVKPSSIFALPGAYSEAERCWGATVELLPEAEYLQLLLSTKWDLAQHSLAANRAERMKRKLVAAWIHCAYSAAWCWARRGCAMLSVVVAAGSLWQVWMQTQTLEAKQRAINSLSQEVFPQLRVVVDAPLQMERELRRLRQSQGVLGRDDFLPMLSAASGALRGAPIQAIEFLPGELKLQGIAEKDIAPFAERLRVLGYAVDAKRDFVHVRPGELL